MRLKPRKKNCDVYGPNELSERVAQNWFKSFQSGNFDVRCIPLRSPSYE